MIWKEVNKGRVREVQISGRYINFELNPTGQEDVIKAIQATLKQGKTLEDLKRDSSGLKRKREAGNREKETIRYNKCMVCKYLVGKARELIASSLSKHFKNDHQSLDYMNMNPFDKFVLLPLTRIQMGKGKGKDFDNMQSSQIKGEI